MRTTDNYDEFDRSLYNHYREEWDININEMNEDDKTLLKNLMFNKGYRKKFNKKDRTTVFLKPTEKQVDYAYDYLKRKFGIREKLLELFIVETHKKRIIKRATSNVSFEGKTYRKGQFLPKNFRG